MLTEKVIPFDELCRNREGAPGEPQPIVRRQTASPPGWGKVLGLGDSTFHSLQRSPRPSTNGHIHIVWLHTTMLIWEDSWQGTGMGAGGHGQLLSHFNQELELNKYIQVLLRTKCMLNDQATLFPPSSTFEKSINAINVFFFSCQGYFRILWD